MQKFCWNLPCIEAIPSNLQVNWMLLMFVYFNCHFLFQAVNQWHLVWYHVHYYNNKQTSIKLENHFVENGVACCDKLCLC